MFKRLRARSKISFVDGGSIIGLPSLYPLRSPSEDLIPTRDSAIEHAVDHVIWHLSEKPIHCTYCKSPVGFTSVDRQVRVTLRRVELRRPAPPGAKDLGLVDHEGWLADLEHGDRVGSCPRCGLRHDAPSGNWGLLNPRYGSSTRDYLYRTDDGFATRKSTIPGKRYTCFSSAAMVLMPDGANKPISQILPGNTVAGYDVETGATTPDLVTACYAAKADEVLVLNHVLEVTASHPFLTATGDWKWAGSLAEGDWLQGAAKAIQITSLLKKQSALKVFNFEVNTSRSYCVSGKGSDYFVVHNGK